MKLKNIQIYVENQLKVDLMQETRKRRNVYARAIFFELATIYARTDGGKKLSIAKIGSYLNQHHSTVLHLRRKTVPIILKHEPEFKRVYENFKKIRYTDLDADIREKYDVLMSDYVILRADYDILKSKKTTQNKDIEQLLKTIDDDKIDIFIERIKPLITMLNKAKFH